VDDPTLEALERLRASGRKLLLVTGREVDDLMRVFPHVHLFDRIVAENGALVYEPGTLEVQSLADAPPDEFVRELQRRALRSRGTDEAPGSATSTGSAVASASPSAYALRGMYSFSPGGVCCGKSEVLCLF
jgi:hypothetical protein